MDRSLYDEDIYAWAEEQAAALRRAAAEPQAAALSGLDLENLAEEIQDVGKTELRATTSFLRQAFVQLAKLVADPGSRAALGWGGEVVRFLADSKGAYAPGMRRAIDLDAVWRDAIRNAHVALRQYGVEMPPDFPVGCPFALGELFAEDFDVEKCRRPDQTAVGRRVRFTRCPGPAGRSAASGAW